MSGMNVLDYVFFGLVLAGAIRGAIVGLSRQLFGLLMLVSALWAAGRFYSTLAPTLVSNGHVDPHTADISSYIILFVGVCVAFLVVRLLLRALIKFAFTRVIEKVGGALVGCAMGAISAAAAMIGLSLIPNEAIHNAVATESWVGRRLTQAFPAFYGRISTQYNLPPIKGLNPDDSADPKASESPDDAESAMQDPPPVTPVEPPPAAILRRKGLHLGTAPVEGGATLQCGPGREGAESVPTRQQSA